jgi:hypothetical protein
MYSIVSTPIPVAVTKPPVVIVAMEGVLSTEVPPGVGVGFPSAVCLTHSTPDVPVIGDGTLSTVMVSSAEQPVEAMV